MDAARKDNDFDIYSCDKNWPENYYIKCSGKDIDKTLDVSFFEIGLKVPKTVIKGTGNTLRSAEEDAWRQWQSILSCKVHSFVKQEGKECCTRCLLKIDPEINLSDRREQLARKIRGEHTKKFMWRSQILQSLNCFSLLLKKIENEEGIELAGDDFENFCSAICENYLVKSGLRDSKKKSIEFKTFIESSELLYKNLFEMYLIKCHGVNSNTSCLELEQSSFNCFKSLFGH